MEQTHLDIKEMTNMGCFYTPDKFVDIVIRMIKKNIPDYKSKTYVDTSCGYGNFLKPLADCKTVGIDIDAEAIERAKKEDKNSRYYVHNALKDFSLGMLGLTGDNSVTLGNPPYNDTTSMVKQKIKDTSPCEIDGDLKSRDLGISFLLSFNKMEFSYVAVLHPLSYIIKKNNFSALKKFFENYSLIDHTVINSQDFSSTSKTAGFPIIIALYKRGKGTSYEEMMKTEFVTDEGKHFNLQQEAVTSFINKYPSKEKEGKIFFYTLRDINALRRSRTFINEPCNNAVNIDFSKLKYYCYIDVFKDYIPHIPYYLGNSEIFIDNEEFSKIEKVFMTKSLTKHPELAEYISERDYSFEKIDEYFKKLLGENYVETENKKEQTVIDVKIPLTSHTGKIRIKRKNAYGYGSPIATRKIPLDKDAYVEWQIGYDLPYKKRDLTSMPDVTFRGYNKALKCFFELSEYVKRFYDAGVVKKTELKKIRDFLSALKEEDMLDFPKEGLTVINREKEAKTFNGVDFKCTEISYPTLIYPLSEDGITAETVVREKQKAVGLQPMLYVTMPVTALKNGDGLIGKKAEAKQTSIFEINNRNINMFVKLLKLFGMFSLAHNHDIISIIDKIIE